MFRFSDSSTDPLAEPFPIGKRSAIYAPIRSPWLLLAVGALLQGGLAFLAILSIVMYVRGTAGDLSLTRLIIGTIVLVVLPLPVFLMGVARVRWMFRYRRLMGRFPVPYDPNN